MNGCTWSSRPIAMPIHWPRRSVCETKRRCWPASRSISKLSILTHCYDHNRSRTRRRKIYVPAVVYERTTRKSGDGGFCQRTRAFPARWHRDGWFVGTLSSGWGSARRSSHEGKRRRQVELHAVSHVSHCRDHPPHSLNLKRVY